MKAYETIFKSLAYGIDYPRLDMAMGIYCKYFNKPLTKLNNMADKKFVGSCKPGKYENQVDVGFQQKDLDAMQNAMNEKGWVNLRLNRGKDSGKPYMEIVTKD